ncbi:GTPase-activating Rap/Ran-GAP domain-like protein 3 isoform X2 [Hydra vulgaris]|uniref:GTPase-activating Rap/Ran-GAP domain-like protein 3 isoform X2 n=1 Tax=Hydra vulgaris TaxID=6087 RepID=A0ABM4BDX2_HYDVU
MADIKDLSIKQTSFNLQNGLPTVVERVGSVSRYSGNILFRSQYYGSMEAVSPDDSSNSQSRKASRFRVEPCEDTKGTQLTIACSPCLAQLENPEFQTRWYFKYFLGQVHCNYVFTDSCNNAYALSICLTDIENQGIPQYRAILWRKWGCRRITFPYDPQKKYTVKDVLRFFMKDKLEKNPREIISAEVQKELLILEEQEGSVNFKFGVIYAKQGQATDDEMFGNECGSEEFSNFLHVLGDVITLQGWNRFRGGLDVKDNMTGTHSLYTMFEGHEVMFHVSVMLPFSKDSQQVERKRHIGNDIAVIVFIDGEPSEDVCFKPSSIRTKFTHVFALVRYSVQTKSYWISVLSEENVPVFGPPLPVPPYFDNPQEFRSFLITKLMNGEKAAYSSPVFSNKRQRTLESLINSLQNDKLAKPEKFMKFSDDTINCNEIRNNPEKRKVFLEFGQALKVNKILQGVAPTSVANVGGLRALKNTPWTPHAVLSSFSYRIHCGDSLDNSLLVSTDLGIFLIDDHDVRQVFDSSMAASQINVIESYNVCIIRVKKNGRIYVIPLSELHVEKYFILCRRHCLKYYIKRSKGSHVYTLSSQVSPKICLAFAVGRRISLLQWNESTVWYASQINRSGSQPPAGFEVERNLIVSEPPRTITITTDINKDLILCLGLRFRFDVINVKTEKVSVIKNIIMYRKPKIVSALDVFDEDNPELLLTYSHSSVFVRVHDILPEITSFYWNNAPKNIVCAFPFLLGFSDNSIEIRLMVNGSLVHTLCVPDLMLITAKNDIYFTSSTINTTLLKKKTVSTVTQTFMKINLSDLAGLSFKKELIAASNEDNSFQRNVGVYSSFSSGNVGRRIPSSDATRTFSFSPVINTKESVDKKSVSLRSSKSIDNLYTYVESKSFSIEEKSSMKGFLNTSMSLLRNATKTKGEGINVFYSPLKTSHSDDMKRNEIVKENIYTPTHRRSLPEKLWIK